MYGRRWTKDEKSERWIKGGYGGKVITVYCFTYPTSTIHHNTKGEGSGERRSKIANCVQTQITDTLKAFGAVNGVRLIRNKQTGEPRGFAFVDFHLVEDAVNLMAYQNKSLFIDGRTVQLEYSTTHTPPLSSSGGSGGSFKDWICPQCNATNFARRTSCYLCNLAKPANPTLAPQPEDAPSSSLIVKGLAATSTDESVCSLLDLDLSIAKLRYAA